MLDRAGSGREPNQFIAVSPRGRMVRVTVEEVDAEVIADEGYSFAEVGT